MAQTNSFTSSYNSPLQASIRICYFCKIEKEHMSTCSKCKIVLYCSRQCQKDDWKNHRLTCSPEQKQEGIKNKQTVKILMKNESFMKVMSSICNLHWKANQILVCSLIETGFLEWNCLIES